VALEQGYQHSELDSSFFLFFFGGELLRVCALAAFLSSSCSMPAASPKMWQLNVSPDIVKYPSGVGTNDVS
jgi:hypothetical protein